jgi:hypothetical protein
MLLFLNLATTHTPTPTVLIANASTPQPGPARCVPREFYQQGPRAADIGPPEQGAWKSINWTGSQAPPKYYTGTDYQTKSGLNFWVSNSQITTLFWMAIKGVPVPKEDIIILTQGNGTVFLYRGGFYRYGVECTPQNSYRSIFFGQLML